MCVNVILCSRNGEKYLRAQIESILKQTEQSVRLLISDDVSSDRTQEIEREYAEQYPERVRVRFRTVPSGGAARHFFLALQYFAEETGDGSLSPSGQSPSGQSPSGQYYMFADQDDIWHPDKVEKTLAAMREAEAAVSEDDEKAENSACTVPLLVHCDMRVVDEEEQEIAPSYVKYQQMSPERCRLNQLLVQNNVTGGAMMMNEALVRLILSRPLPRHAVMHDHWIALAAARAAGSGKFLTVWACSVRTEKQRKRWTAIPLRSMKPCSARRLNSADSTRPRRAAVKKRRIRGPRRSYLRSSGR